MVNLSLDRLSDSNVLNLRNLQACVTMKDATSHRRRIGENKFNNLSIYSYSRYLTWKSSQRELFFANFPQCIVPNAKVFWYLKFPQLSGFLDTMTSWVGVRSPAYINSYCIDGLGKIIVNETEYTIPIGMGISFPVSDVHEVPKTELGSVWACALTLTDVWSKNSESK